MSSCASWPKIGAPLPFPLKPSRNSSATLRSSGRRLARSAMLRGTGGPLVCSAGGGTTRSRNERCSTGRGRAAGAGLRQRLAECFEPRTSPITSATTTIVPPSNTSATRRRRRVIRSAQGAKAIFLRRGPPRFRVSRDRGDEVRRHLGRRRRADHATPHGESSPPARKAAAWWRCSRRAARPPTSSWRWPPRSRRGRTRARWTCCSPPASASRARWPRWRSTTSATRRSRSPARRPASSPTPRTPRRGSSRCAPTASVPRSTTTRSCSSPASRACPPRAT